MKKIIFNFLLLNAMLLCSFIVSYGQNIVATGTVTDVHCHGDSTGSIAYQINGGTGAVHYIWNTGDSGTSVSGCTYTVHITNTGPLLSSFQVKVPVTLASGMNANFSNVQFTDTTGVVLPFWLQNFPTATTATFWVRVPGLPTGTTDIYLSFCGTAAVTGNPTGTFEFFDNFDNNTLPLWTQACVSSMAGTTCNIYADNATYFSPNYSAHLQGGSTCFTPPYSGAGAIISRAINPIVNDSLVLDYEDKSGATLYGYCSGGTGSTNSALDNNISIGNGQGQSHGGSCATTLSGWAAETSQPFLVTTGSTTISLKEYGGDCDNSDGWFDDVRIRKYTSNPPTVAIDTTPLLYLNDLAAGQYVITMTGSTGTFKDTFVVTQPTAVIAMPDSVNINCHDSATGVAWVVTPIGGTPGYTFLWSTAQTTDTISVLAPGVYRVTVTDSYGCRDSAAVNIIQPSTSLSLTPDSENVKCFGQTTGLAWAIVSGGTPGYSYLWSGSGQTTDTAINLGQGSYTVTVSDAQHCSAVATVDIAQPSSAPGVTFSTVNIVCKGVNNGKIVATASGGTSGYTYLWSTAQTTDSLTDQGAGSYTISVTDANGCTVSGTTAILPSGDSIAIDTATSPATCGSANGSITVSVSGGSGVYQYAWSNDSTGASISSLAGDTVYKVTVTDAAGCRDSIAVFLHQSAALIATVSTQNDSCNEQAGSASISINSGDPPYTYQWTPAGTDTARLDSGTYSVLITDAAGCSVTKTFTITNIDNNCQSLVLFPTAFTPNGDGKNDQFYAVYSPDLDKLQMRIYDRWGQLVFEASNDTQQWDGTYKGAPQPIGVYIWFAEYNFTNKPTQAVTGNVTLIR